MRERDRVERPGKWLMTERNETKGQAPLAPMRHFSVGRLAAAALALVILLAIFSVVVVESGQVGVVVRTGAESPSRGTH